MPYTPHTLIAFGGRLTEGTGYGEIWECTVRGGSTNNSDNTHLRPFNTADLDRVAADMATAIKAWFAGGGNGISNDTALDYVKANNIGADGKYVESITHQVEISPAVNGAATPNVPNFLSLAYTWETGLLRGRAHRGRMYPPNNTYSFQGGLAGLGNAGTARTAAVALMNAMIQATNEGTLEDKFAPAVMSRIDASWHWITGVSVDSVWDVQRRRKNQAPSQRTGIAPLTL